MRKYNSQNKNASGRLQQQNGEIERRVPELEIGGIERKQSLKMKRVSGTRANKKWNVHVTGILEGKERGNGVGLKTLFEEIINKVGTKIVKFPKPAQKKPTINLNIWELSEPQRDKNSSKSMPLTCHNHLNTKDKNTYVESCEKEHLTGENTTKRKVSFSWETVETRRNGGDFSKDWGKKIINTDFYIEKISFRN